MGLGHRYQLVKDGENTKDEAGDITREEPRPAGTPIIISWWKFLLCNLLAAGIAAGVTLLIAHGSFATKPGANSTTDVATSNTSSSDLTLPTGLSIEHLEGKTGPNMLAGEILECGGNPGEAREKGCVYDVMMQDWVPEPCYDSVLTEKYLAEGNWTWYGDGDGNTTIPDEVMRKGEHGAAWMSTSYHKAHCVFSWIKIIRALRNNRGISQELLSYDHVLHCSMGALKAREGDEGLGVRAPTNYAKCALYDTWREDLIPDKHDSSQR